MGRLAARRGALVAAAAAVWAALACQGGPADPPPRGGIYARLGCAGCHGPRGQGGPAAPPLGDLSRHWEGERLLGYLRDPDTVKAGDARLVALSGRYPLRMPAVRAATDDELRELARELLAE